MSEEAVPGRRRQRAGTARSANKLFTRNFVLICLSSFFFQSSGQTILPAIPVYITQLGSSQTEVGLVVACYSLGSIASRPLFGRLADRGLVAQILLFGTCNFVLSALGYNLATSIGLLVLLRLFHGLGISSFTTAAGWIVAESSPRHRRGEAVGYYGVASNVAMALGPALGVAILEATNFTTLSVGAAMVGLLALGLSSRIRVEQKSPSPTVASSAIISRSAIPPSLVLVTMCFAAGTTLTFIPVYALERGIENVGFFYTAYAAASVIFRSISGRAADQWGRHVVVLPGLVLLALGVASLSLGLGFWGVVVAGLLMGTGFGFALPGLMALMIDRAGPGERGSATSTFFGSFDLGMGLGAGVSGILAQQAGFEATFAGAGLVVMLGFAYFFSALRPRARAMT